MTVTSKFAAAEWQELLRVVRRAALDRSPVSGLTHRFYRYPARFSPAFASAIIEAFSARQDVVLDPFMGGGTTVVEGMAMGRTVVGCDVNSLGVFITRVKTTPLTALERQAVAEWADQIVPSFSYRSPLAARRGQLLDDRRARNLSLPCARPIKKLIAQALLSLPVLPTERSRAFVRCALLNVGQWALNGCRQHTPLTSVRAQLSSVVHQMLDDIVTFEERVRASCPPDPILINDRASELRGYRPFARGRKADLVVTSPPYPGIHVIYHRWQVDGRRETPAPYWISACRDGQGAAFYNFADHREKTNSRYFQELEASFKAVRRSLKDGAAVVQMVAFGDQRRHLPRYLDVMTQAGFAEVRAEKEMGALRHHRIWRTVPGRRWHAFMKGALPSAREVVLIHRAR